MPTSNQIQSPSGSRHSDSQNERRDVLIQEIDQAATPVPGATTDSPVESGGSSHSGTEIREADDLSDSDQQWDGYLSDPGEAGLPPIRPTDWTGRTVGADNRYEILHLLGKGGMGKVYLARARNLNGTHVALKVPYESFLELTGMRERFEREFKALIQLAHPHICRVLDTGHFRNVPFVVLQNLSGGTLRDRYLSQPAGSPSRSVEHLLKWLREIARALDYMHSQGFLHRDVKPENILFDNQGNAYLSDFGIVRVLEDAPQADSTLTRPGECIGTLGYVAPELLKGKRDSADGRSDLYSLASVVYLYLTDKPPFDGDTNDMIRVAQLTETPVPAHEANPQVPEAASLAIERALSREPADRPTTCESFVDELAAAYGLTDSRSASPVIVTPRRDASESSIGNETSGRRTRNTLVTAGLVATAIALLAFVRPPKHDPFSVGSVPGPTLIVETELAMSNAEGYLEAGEFQAAIDEINSLPGELLTADHHSIRGRAFFGLNDDETALAELDRAIALAPGAGIYHSERSQILLAEGDFQAAVKELAKAIEKNPSEPRFHAQRAIVRLQLNEYESVIADYGNALELASDQISNAEKAAWHNGKAAAQVLLSSDADSIRRALVDATAAVDAQPQESRHYRNRAQLYERLGDRTAQQRDLETASRLDQSP